MVELAVSRTQAETTQHSIFHELIENTLCGKQKDEAFIRLAEDTYRRGREMGSKFLQARAMNVLTRDLGVNIAMRTVTDLILAEKTLMGLESAK